MLATAAAIAAFASPAAPVSVHVPSAPSATTNVTIGFHPKGPLPHGGYYYAVVVLTNYPGYSLTSPPPCAISSDMQKTVYAYPRGGRRLQLTLLPAKSNAGQWCSGGTYEGAVYAVPHKPPCTAAYPCTGSAAEYGGDCWEVDGRPVCGVVVPPKEPVPQGGEPPSKQPEAPDPPQPEPSYSYPGGLPKPIDRSARIVAHFTLRFPSASSS